MSGEIAAIVPVLDEELRIGPCLAALRAVSGIAEIVVVDGGSGDRTVAIARSVPGVRVMETTRGRGSQMNAGAAEATADVLLFVHADVQLPEDAARWIARTLMDVGVVAGAFRTRTVADQASSWVARFLPLADIRSRVSALPYGDQALFVRRAAFERVEGFPDQPLMEDLELAYRLRRLGRIAQVPATVNVSGRRFLAHPMASILAMRLFPTLYRLGVSPQALAWIYGRPR